MIRVTYVIHLLVNCKYLERFDGHSEASQLQEAGVSRRNVPKDEKIEFAFEEVDEAGRRGLEKGRIRAKGPSGVPRPLFRASPVTPPPTPPPTLSDHSDFTATGRHLASVDQSNPGKRSIHAAGNAAG